MNLFDYMDKLEEELYTLPEEDLIKLILHFARNLNEFQRNDLYEHVKKLKRKYRKRLREAEKEEAKEEQDDTMFQS